MILGVPVQGWVAIALAVIGVVIWLVRLESKTNGKLDPDKAKADFIPRPELNVVVIGIKEDIEEIKTQNDKQFSAINDLGKNVAGMSATMDLVAKKINGGR